MANITIGHKLLFIPTSIFKLPEDPFLKEITFSFRPAYLVSKDMLLFAVRRTLSENHPKR